jgi:hypothetical protein
MRIIGVPPMASRTLAQIFFTNQVYTARRLTEETAWFDKLTIERHFRQAHHERSS